MNIKRKFKPYSCKIFTTDILSLILLSTYFKVCTILSRHILKDIFIFMMILKEYIAPIILIVIIIYFFNTKIPDFSINIIILYTSH